MINRAHIRERIFDTLQDVGRASSFERAARVSADLRRVLGIEASATELREQIRSLDPNGSTPPGEIADWLAMAVHQKGLGQ